MQREAVSVRTVFLSDLHLGFRYARPAAILCFLKRFRPNELYLVGDLIDGWCFQNSWHWDPDCSRVLDRLVDLLQQGTKIRIAIGNHDAFLRQPLFQSLAGSMGQLELSREFSHQLPDGRRLLVTHGDQFDPFEKLSRFSTGVLSCLYNGLLAIDCGVSRWFRGERSGSVTLPSILKRASGFVAAHARRFRAAASRYARCRGFHGIVCGHIHYPDHVQFDGFSYFNTGDWIENCTALVEDLDGRFHLLRTDQPEPPLTLNFAERS